jgi:hypothetical protein
MDMYYGPLMRDVRNVTVQTSSTVIAGFNQRRVRLTISPPLSFPVNVDPNTAATLTGGYPLVVGGFPLVLGDGVTVGEYGQQVSAIANGGAAQVQVTDEFKPQDYFP